MKVKMESYSIPKEGVNMIKKLILVLSMCLLLGCNRQSATSDNGDTNRVLNAEKVSSQLLRKLGIEDQMEQVRKKVIDNVFFQGEDLTDDKSAYLAIDKGNSNTIAVFVADEDTSVDVLREKLLVYLNNQKVTIEYNYPTEVFKISNAVIEDNGRVVVLVISDIIEDARKYVDEILK